MTRNENNDFSKRGFIASISQKKVLDGMCYASMVYLCIIYAHFPYRWNSNIVSSFSATWLVRGRTFLHQHWNKYVANKDWFVHDTFSSDRYGVLSLAGLFTPPTCTKDCTDIFNEVWKWNEAKTARFYTKFILCKLTKTSISPEVISPELLLESLQGVKIWS